MPMIQAGATQLEYFEHGTGADVLVLIHGAGSSALIWDTVQRNLAKQGWRTIAISLPGAGASDRTDNLSDYTPASYARSIRAALDGLAISRCAIAGHSLGVSNVLCLASDHADGLSLRAQILMAGGNVVGREAETPERAAALKASYSPPDPATEQARRAGWELLHRGLTTDVRDRLWRDIENNPAARIIGQRLGARRDMTDFAATCDIPTLVLSGDADSVVPLEYTLAMYPKFRRDVRFCHVLHGVDHYPNAEVPDEVAAVYHRFLRAHQR